MKIEKYEDLVKVRDKGLSAVKPDKPGIAVGMSTCGMGNGADRIYEEFRKELEKQGVDAVLRKTGCFGFCAEEPFVNIYIPGKPLTIMKNVEKKDIKEAVSNIKKGEPKNSKTFCKIEKWNHHTSQIEYGSGLEDIPLWNEVGFYKGQQKDVLRDCGLIDPEEISEYIGVGGYGSLYSVLSEMTGEDVLAEIKESGLRGRGGAGFPVWIKWNMLKKNKENPKYIFCNADEGDPGAYMNRNELEGDPHMVIEGMIIAGFVTGAKEGVIYCRAEYPVAVERLKRAIKQAEEIGILGENIMGRDFSFNIKIVEGAGAFVCGEETALISSVHGKPGWPMPRPPYPSEKGLYGKPTCINNVETLSNIPMIIAVGGKKFSSTGTPESTGTKVFSLVGKVKNTGLVELPLGTPLKKLIYDIGGGAGGNKKVKAVQTGGPSGGCIPAEKFESTIDYEALKKLGAIMGSGGVVVMDEDNCMVDVAHYFTEFTTSESCGKCVPCREGINHSLDMLRRIKNGQGDFSILKELDNLSEVIKDSALCGLGQTGPNPVVTTMKYFMEEYRQHIKENYCDGGVCGELFISPCENSCPLHMNIPGYLELFLEEKEREAFELILQDNPLPASIGRICHFHCKMRCRREDIDAPVNQGEVHRYIADKFSKEGKLEEFSEIFRKRRLPSSGKKIAVVGGGPAGLTAAFYLEMLGHNVTVYDREESAGGILRWGIPAYRLPRNVLEREIRFIEKTGVKFRLGRDMSPADIKKLRGKNDAVIMATGAYKSRELKVKGNELNGVHHGISLLRRVASGKEPELKKKVVVIGGGNVAIDAARTALRYGCDVTVVYRRGREDMPANVHEIEDAIQEGIDIRFWRSPVEFKGESGALNSLRVEISRPGECDITGRRSPVRTGKFEEIKCDNALIAIGESVDEEFLSGCGFEVSPGNTLKADPCNMEVSEGIYTAGDVFSGPATAAQAMALGKKAARGADAKLMGESRFGKIIKNYSYKMAPPDKPDGSGPRRPGRINISERKKNFKEVVKGFTKNQVRTEAGRCLRCDVKVD